MKITNKFNLPQSIVNAVSFNGHKKGTGYSVTEILKPVKVIHLTERHIDEIEEDCSERIWALLGSAVHTVLERGADKNSLNEQFMTSEIDGVQLSGTPDLLDADGNLSDYKITSAWSVVYGSRLKEWTEQLNVYIWLFKQHGFEVKKANIIAIFRDWSEMKAMQSDNYPKSTVQTIPVEIWTAEKQLEFIKAKLTDIVCAKAFTDDELPDCTAEQMWQKEDVYAVMKKGRKSAVKLFEKEDEANALVKEGKGDEVVKRCGERTRCEKYCSVNAFCKQFKEYKNG